jgi:hypothetical protein
MPDPFEPTDRHREIAAEDGLDLDREVRRMKRWAAEKDVRRANWNATFTNWLNRAEPAAGGGRSASPPSSSEFNGNELEWG